jgi:uncharacterized protein (DUF427 family)
MSSNPKTIKIPGPDHPITIEHNRDRVVVKVAGRVVADTRDALTLREASYAPVHYIPRLAMSGAKCEPTVGIAASETHPCFRPISIKRCVSGEPTLSGSLAFV